MITHVPSLDQLIHELHRMPGVGLKTAQRLAYHLLRSPNEHVENMRLALRRVKEHVHECPECFTYTEEDICHLCNDLQREVQSICVVEDPANIAHIESSGVFRGYYHVLHGAISPLDGISPKDLKVDSLADKIKKSLASNQPIQEVILALDADLEGDTTVLYLTKILGEISQNLPDDKKIKVTRIAHGVPIGGNLDYIDHRTLGRALENRIQL